jgi:PAS domain S-box-containing protein
MIIQRVSSTSNFITWFGSLLLMALFGWLGWLDYQQKASVDVLQKWALAFLVSELLMLLLLSDMQRVTRQLMRELQQSHELKQQYETQQSKKYQQALSTLNNIAASFAPDWREQLRQALKVAAEYLQLPMAMLSEVSQQDYQLIVHSADAAISLDHYHYALSDTCCSITLQQAAVFAVHRLSASPYAGLHCQQAFLTESYIGAPVQVEGKTFGTVSFSASKARLTPFSQLEREFVSLLARWIGATLERRLYIEAQVETAARLEKIASQVPGMVYQFRLATDGSSSFPYCSDGIRDIYQLTPEQVKHDASLAYAAIHPDDLQQVRDSITLSAAQLSLWKQDYRIQFSDGEIIWVTGRAVPERQADGSILWHGFINDITERKKIERLKDEFVSTVSHELRTPLTAISGAIGLLHGKVLGELPSQAMQMTELAQANVKKLQLLINDLLDMDKLIAGKMQFNMQIQPLLPVIETVIRDNQSYAQQYQVSYQLQVDNGELWVNIDNMRLQQVMTNLLSNAAKFSPAGATVVIRLQQQGNNALITVIDQGVGISDDFKSQIFSQFSQADSSDSKSKGGTGLGLAISKQLMTRMQGEIGFHSTLNEGSAFYLVLPLASSTEETEEQQ